VCRIVVRYPLDCAGYHGRFHGTIPPVIQEDAEEPILVEILSSSSCTVMAFPRITVEAGEASSSAHYTKHFCSIRLKVFCDAYPDAIKENHYGSTAASGR
jgi:hypothetical protein